MSSPQSPSTASERVYHLQLRHFPRNMCRFNLSGEELRATVLGPWVADRPFDLGELRWDPRHAQITVIEGPRMPLEQLSMGRGWRAAQRAGRDVTAEMLAAVGEAPAPGPGSAGEADRAAGPTRSADPIADSLGLRLLAQIGDDPTPLRHAWELASAENPERPASETLAIAERAVASLLGMRLIVLLRATEPESAPKAMGEQEALAILRALESWTGSQLSIRRA